MIEKIQKHFEANMIDWQPIDDCGWAMLNAKYVLEYIQEFYVLQAQEKEVEIETFSINLIVDWFTNDYKAHIEKKFEEILIELEEMDIQYYELKIDKISNSREFNLRPKP